jgi:hypothetical protein
MAGGEGSAEVVDAAGDGVLEAAGMSIGYEIGVGEACDHETNKIIPQTAATNAKSISPIFMSKYTTNHYEA